MLQCLPALSKEKKNRSEDPVHNNGCKTIYQSILNVSGEKLPLQLFILEQSIQFKNYMLLEKQRTTEQKKKRTEIETNSYCKIPGAWDSRSPNRKRIPALTRDCQACRVSRGLAPCLWKWALGEYAVNLSWIKWIFKLKGSCSLCDWFVDEHYHFSRPSWTGLSPLPYLRGGGLFS